MELGSFVTSNSEVRTGEWLGLDLYFICVIYYEESLASCLLWFNKKSDSENFSVLFSIPNDIIILLSSK